MKSHQHRRLIRGAILALVVVGGFFVAWGIRAFPPTEASFYPRCQLNYWTGLHCPGCGATRAMHSLLNGDVKQAAAYNVLALFTVPFLGILLLRSLWSWMWELPIKSGGKNHSWIAISICVLLMLFAVLRNIPSEPFSWLAPHEIVHVP